MQVSM